MAFCVREEGIPVSTDKEYSIRSSLEEYTTKFGDGTLINIIFSY